MNLILKRCGYFLKDKKNVGAVHVVLRLQEETFYCHRGFHHPGTSEWLGHPGYCWEKICDGWTSNPDMDNSSDTSTWTVIICKTL